MLGSIGQDSATIPALEAITKSGDAATESPDRATTTMIIPYHKLSPEALRGVIEEHVTRDGTELTDAGAKIEQVKRQLEGNKLVITYDEKTRTCNIVPAEMARDEDANAG